MAKLSRRYATAFYELAAQRGLLGILYKQADIALLATRYDSFDKVITNPSIPKRDKYKLFRDVLTLTFKNKLREELINFLNLIIAKNREKYLYNILRDFTRMCREDEAKANVISATPLSTAQKAHIQKVLSKKTGKKIELDVKVNTDALGGIFMYVDEVAVDRSVRNALDNLTEFVINRRAGGIEQPLQNQEGLLS